MTLDPSRHVALGHFKTHDSKAVVIRWWDDQTQIEIAHGASMELRRAENPLRDGVV
jgi:hypothetical protein